METIPHGQLSTRVTDQRFEITTPGALYGVTEQVLDKAGDTFMRDGNARCALSAIARVEVQTFWQGYASSHGFQAVVIAGDDSYTLYTSDDKEAVAQLVQGLGAFLGVETGAREQPMQRQLREKLGIGGPEGAGAVNALRETAGAVNTGAAIYRAVVLGLVSLAFIGGATVQGVAALGSQQQSMLAVAAVFGAIGALMLFGAVRSLVRLSSGRAGVDGVGVSEGDALEEGRLPSIFALAGRTGLSLGLMATVLPLALILGLTVIRPGVTGRNDLLFVLVVGGSICGFGIWTTIKATKRLRTWWGVLRAPVRAEAVVLAVKTTNYRVNREIRLALEYQYQDETGATYTEESHHLTPAEAQVWHEHDVAVVHYDRNQPANSILTGRRPIRRTTREERVAAGLHRTAPRWHGGTTADDASEDGTAPQP
jgi:hypothetical protein